MIHYYHLKINLKNYQKMEMMKMKKKNKFINKENNNTKTNRKLNNLNINSDSEKKTNDKIVIKRKPIKSGKTLNNYFTKRESNKNNIIKNINTKINKINKTSAKNI